MLPGKMHAPFRTLSYRKQSRHLARLKVSKSTPSELIFVPDLARTADKLTVQSAKQVSHLSKHKTLTIILTYRAQVECSLPAGVRGQNPVSSFLRQRR